MNKEILDIIEALTKSFPNIVIYQPPVRFNFSEEDISDDFFSNFTLLSIYDTNIYIECFYKLSTNNLEDICVNIYKNKELILCCTYSEIDVATKDIINEIDN